YRRMDRARKQRLDGGVVEIVQVARLEIVQALGFRHERVKELLDSYPGRWTAQVKIGDGQLPERLHNPLTFFHRAAVYGGNDDSALARSRFGDAGGSRDSPEIRLRREFVGGSSHEIAPGGQHLPGMLSGIPGEAEHDGWPHGVELILKGGNDPEVAAP